MLKPPWQLLEKGRGWLNCRKTGASQAGAGGNARVRLSGEIAGLPVQPELE